MEILKQLPADVQCMVLRRTSITRQLTSLHRLPVELHCMRSERHPTAIMLVSALWQFLKRHNRMDVALLYVAAIDDFAMWRRSERKRLVDFNRRCIERLVMAGVDFHVAKGGRSVVNFARNLELDYDEYDKWLDYIYEIDPSVVHDEMDPSSEQPTS